MEIPGFTTLGLLGRGGMGEVYRVRGADGQEWALKVLTGLGDDLQRLRFLREFGLARDLDHPGLLRLGAQGEHAGQHYYTMEIVEGQPFHSYLRVHPDQAGDVVAQLFSVLDYVHARGILHRDLKPENVLVDESGRLRLLDFGLARRENESRLTASGAIVGTPAYMAPEQLMGSELDARADLFSAGVMIYEALAGRHPFPGKDIFTILNCILSHDPEPLEDHPGGPLVHQMLSKDPFARPPSAGECARLWAAALGAESGGARPRPTLAGLLAPPLVGRDSAWKIFDELLAAGRGVCLVEGNAGVGRSRLLQEWTRAARAAGWTPRLGSASRVPYQAWLEPLRSALPLPPGLDLYRGSLALLLPELGPPDPRQDDLLKLHLFEGMERLLEHAGGFVVLDDLDEADPASREFFEFCARQDRPGRILIASCRSGTLPGARRLRLEPLTADETGQAASAMLGGGALAPATQERLYRETGGNPLFVRELLQLLVSQGRVVDREGSWQIEAWTSEGFVDGLKTCLARRLEGLEPEVTRLLDWIALGGERTFHELSALTARPPADLLDALETLKERGLLRGQADRYDFPCTMLRTLVEEALSGARAAQIHLCLSEHCQGPEERALHLEKAGRPEQAADQLLLAADASLRRYAFGPAAEGYERAFRLRPELRAGCLEKYADALQGSGQRVEARQLYAECRPASPPPGKERGEGVERARLLRKRASCTFALGRLDEARAELEEALRALGAELPRRSRKALLKTYLSLLALVALGQGRKWSRSPAWAAEMGRIGEIFSRVAYLSRYPGWGHDTLELMLQGSALLRAESPDLELERAEVHLSIGLVYLGFPPGFGIPRARQHLRLATEHVRTLPDSPAKATYLRDLGFCRFSAAEYEGRQLLVDSLELAHRLGELTSVPTTLTILATSDTIFGWLDRADGFLEQLESLVAHTGNPIDACFLRILRAFRYAWGRDAQRARACLEEAVQLREPLEGCGLLQMHLRTTQAWVLLAERRWDDALRAARETLRDPALQLPINRFYLRDMLNAEAQILTERLVPGSPSFQADTAEALKKARQLRKEAMGLYYALEATTFRLEGRVLTLKGDAVGARRAYQEGLQRGQSGTIPLEEALCLEGLADLTPESDEANSLRQRARALREASGSLYL